MKHNFQKGIGAEMAAFDRQYVALFLFGGLLAVVTPFSETALASGYIGPTEWREKMPDFAACLSQLHARASENRDKLTPRKFALDGSFREVSIEEPSSAVQSNGRKSAHYKAKIWYISGQLDDEGTNYVLNHSWEENSYECNGRTMTVITSQGYTLSNFVPVATIRP